MANTGFKGLDVRQTGNEIVFRAFLQTSAGALVTSGATNFYLMELQSDGTINTYDFSSNTFKSGAVTTESLAATYRKSNNATTDTGLWTASLSTLTGFTVGAIYLVRVNNSGASPTDQMREFQYGSAEGDLTVTQTTTGSAILQAGMLVYAGTATGGTSNTITNSGASWGTNNFQLDQISIIAGTGSPQTMNIVSNTATVITIDKSWVTTPDATSVFVITASDVPLTNSSGQVAVQPGTGAGQINLSSGAVPVSPYQTLPTDATGNQLANCLLGAGGNALGKLTISSDGTTATVYAPDNTTVLKTFTLTPPLQNPVSRA